MELREGQGERERRGEGRDCLKWSHYIRFQINVTLQSFYKSVKAAAVVVNNSLCHDVIFLTSEYNSYHWNNPFNAGQNKIKRKAKKRNFKRKKT